MITKHTGSTKNKKYTKHTDDTKATCIPRLPTLHRLTSIPRMAIPSDCRIISSTISFLQLWRGPAGISCSQQYLPTLRRHLRLPFPTSHLSPLTLVSQLTARRVMSSSGHSLPTVVYQQWCARGRLKTCDKPASKRNELTAMVP